MVALIRAAGTNTIRRESTRSRRLASVGTAEPTTQIIRNQQSRSFAGEYKVQGFPTIKLMYSMGRSSSGTTAAAVQPRIMLTLRWTRPKFCAQAHRGQAQTELSGGSGSGLVLVVVVVALAAVLLVARPSAP
jgi:hypothetical protein